MNRDFFYKMLYPKITKAVKICGSGNAIDMRLHFDDSNLCYGIYSIFEVDNLYNAINDKPNVKWFIDFYENIKDANSAEFIDVTLFSDEVMPIENAPKTMSVEEFDAKWGETPNRDEMDFETELEFIEDAFNMYETSGFSATYHSIYKDEKNFNGVAFQVIGRASYSNGDCDFEQLPMWHIEFEDGTKYMAFPEEITKIEKEKQTLAQNLQKEETEKPIKKDTTMVTEYKNTFMARDIVDMIIADAKQGYPDYNGDQLHEVIKISLGNAFDCFCESSTYYRLADIRRTFKDFGYYPCNNNVAGLLDEIILAEMDVYTKTTEQEYKDIIKTITNMAEDMFVEMYDLTKKEAEQFNIFLWDRTDMVIEWTILDVKNFTPENKEILDNYFEECFEYSPNRGGVENKFPSANLRKCKELVKGNITDNMSMTFAILNTKNYDDGDNMGYTIVQGISPELLYNYGFDTTEVEEAGKLPIGGTMKSYLYGDGVILVRMS